MPNGANRGIKAVGVARSNVLTWSSEKTDFSKYFAFPSTVGDTLEPLANLMKLNLSDNYITSLPRNAFHSLEKLSTLDVSNNTIVEVGK